MRGDVRLTHAFAPFQLPRSHATRPAGAKHQTRAKREQGERSISSPVDASFIDGGLRASAWEGADNAPSQNGTFKRLHLVGGLSLLASLSVGVRRDVVVFKAGWEYTELRLLLSLRGRAELRELSGRMVYRPMLPVTRQSPAAHSCAQ